MDGGLIAWPPVRRRLGQSCVGTNRWALRGPAASALLQEDEEEDERVVVEEGGQKRQELIPLIF